MTPCSSSTVSFTDRAIHYCRSIFAKEHPASRYTIGACQRFLDDLERTDWRWIYDPARAHKVCSFIQLCPHEKGAKQSTPFLLEDFQVFIVCSIFGFVDRDTQLRRFREAVLLIPRKNGKSPLAAAIALYMTFFDGEKGAETYCGALTEQQAFEVFRPAKAMLEGMPALCKRYGIEINAKSLVQPTSRSRMMPVIGTGRDGSMPHLFVGDEAHQWRDASLYDAQSTGMVGRKQPLKLIITTAGETISGPAHSKQREVEALLDGKGDNERLFGVIYTADPEIPWTSREALLSANPNIGVSVSEESLIEAQAEAIRNSAKQGTFRCKHLNHWITASSAWMNMEFFRKCADSALSPDAFLDDPCILSSDLASKIDLCALCKLFRRDIEGKPHYYAFVQCYVPESRVNDPANQHFQKWCADGLLTSTPGSSIDYATLERDTLADIAKFKVSLLAYDERYADQFSQRVAEQSGIDRVIIPPSPRELSPAMKELESAVYDGRFHYDGNPLLEWAMGNVLTHETVAGNLTMPDKPAPEAKIDPAIAIFLAMNRAMLLDPADKTSAFEPFFL
ncbi:terminase large subunit [Granulicella mallensis]|uniref:Terminase n=1 Tax=Granulicella mallensis (strain ATCC BAA-1857 / DSM 23137 / MP5ACTX8) TaxID=682795 RepID=G8NR93_GRAMM|nr:terminase large subunit [Granulicella mallensis]AEU36171.1 Terminase [Granulicella mallensis MP5ACTX8]